MTEWYSRSEEEVLRELSSCRRGLTDAEAHSRLEKVWGKLFYMSERLYPGGRFFLSQFKDLLVVILMIAAGISMATGDPESALVIFTVLFLKCPCWERSSTGRRKKIPGKPSKAVLS